MHKSESNDSACASSKSQAARFRSLFDNRLVGIDIVDAEGRWVEINDRLCELLGRSREELTGRRLDEFTHHEDLEVEAALARRLFNGEIRSYRLEKRFLRGDGGWARVEVDALLVDDEPGPLRASVILDLGDRERDREESARLQTLVEQSPLGVVVIDPETARFLQFNETAHESLGYAREEFAGLTLADIDEQKTHEAAVGRIAMVLKTGRARFEASQWTRKGELRRVRVTARRVFLDGRPCVQSVWQEVAASRDSSTEQARQDATIRQILRTAPLPMGIAELREDDGDILHIFDNRAACRSFARPAGSTSGRWGGAELGMDGAALKAWIAAYRASQRLGRAVHFEDGRDFGGEQRWLRIVVSYVGPATSGRDRFCYIAEDITERKRAEAEILRLNRSLERRAAELQTIFEVIPIGVGIADDPECRSIRANPALARILGTEVGVNVSLNAPESERPTTFKAFHGGHEVAVDDLPMQVSAKRGIALHDVEIDVAFEDGRVVNLLEHVSPLFDEQGSPRGCVAAILDVTEWRRAQRERERLLEDLREADRRKDEFLAMLAHELRNPLSAAGNAAEILRLKEPDDPETRWCCEVIERQTRRLARLLEDLLDVSRITRGKIVLRRETMDLRGAVERAVETIRPMIEERRHQVEVHLPAEPLWVHADPARIEQVVVNLLGNAAKYSEEGRSVSVTVSRNGESAVVRVEDQGIGMSPAVLEKVFEMFSQVESSIDRSRGGLGIGLTIARSLVELHDGRISATSEGLGSGSTFLVRLPCVGDPAPDDPSPPRPANATRATPRRIVVVDDNVEAVVALARLLELAGHTVATAFDGPSGLEAVDDFRPDVILLDVGLPGMDGYQVAERLRSLPDGHALFLVALTGYGQESDRHRAFDAGFDRHLIKPVEVETILEVIASALPPS
ncbi:PAS domain S-box protein [Planctomyces sp. SH-PL62]|uniref:hybrid sensor histidine kinase/response regulator n=1 Tax=Planctomyces sp. SH-PL62 TaxID=1636152 RepID=UPI00078C9A3F|nr:PAS domain S-box protein [Planctomyces sp. SH-PL62]AMV38712.1 Autoinducer 2 sensor kinase/phosphatase LuxQ [Planctomyces sp. SH-PL62]